MAFFFSGRNASVAGIFKRSARYWITSYVYHSLFGPRGLGARRGNRMRAKAVWTPRPAYSLDPIEAAEQIGHDTAVEGCRKGWSDGKILRVAKRRVRRITGVRPDEGCWDGNDWVGDAATVAAIATTPSTAPSAPTLNPRPNTTPSSAARIARPAAQNWGGGLRGSIVAKWLLS